MTLNQLKALFKSIGDAHYFINTTEFGDPPAKAEANREDNYYPAFYQVVTDTVVREQTLERTVSLIVADLVYPGKENLDEVLSDTEQTLGDIVKILRQESDFYNVIGDPQLIDFKDRYGDAVAGWQVDIVIETQNNSAYCDIPAMDFGFPGGSDESGLPLSDWKCSDLLGCQLFNDLVDRVERINGISPISYDNTSGSISITQVSTTVDGYLSAEQYTELLNGSGGSSLPATYIGYGDNTNTLTGSSDLTFTTSPANKMIGIAQGGLNLGFNINSNNSYILGLGGEFLLYSINGNCLISLGFNGRARYSANIMHTFEGPVSVSSLIGVGSRMVVADASGVLSTQAIPAGASLDETYIGFGDSNNSITGNSSFIWNNTAQYIFIDESYAVGRLQSSGGTITYGLQTTDINSILRLFAGGNTNIMLTPETSIEYDAPIHHFLDGSIQVDDLSGSGVRMVVSDSNGILSTQSIPSGGGSVNSVSGTANRITSTGGIDPVIDIAATYIGQSSITTLGTITSGVWSGTAITDSYIASSSTWNAKQNALNGTGLVRMSGTSVSYDNKNYVPMDLGVSDTDILFFKASDNELSSNPGEFQYDSINKEFKNLGGVRFATTMPSSQYTTVPSDYVILYDTDAFGSGQVDLVQATSAVLGKILIIKNSGATGNTLKVSAFSGDKIDGQDFIELMPIGVLPGSINAITIHCDGSNWNIVSTNNN